MIVLACPNCAITAWGAAVLLVTGGAAFLVSCFKCFCFKFKKRKKCDCECHGEISTNEEEERNDEKPERLH